MRCAASGDGGWPRSGVTCLVYTGYLQHPRGLSNLRSCVDQRCPRIQTGSDFSTTMSWILQQSQCSCPFSLRLCITSPVDQHQDLGSPTRSIYSLTKKEITQGIANRFVHSRVYIILYLSMTALSVTTIALSITDGCPGLAFYILEIIINTSMIVEVAIRFVAFGRVSSIAQNQLANRLSRRLTCLTAGDAAILEVSVQHPGPHYHTDMCDNHPCYLLRRMWLH